MLGFLLLAPWPLAPASRQIAEKTLPSPPFGPTRAYAEAVVTRSRKMRSPAHLTVYCDSPAEQVKPPRRLTASGPIAIRLKNDSAALTLTGGNKQPLRRNLEYAVVHVAS